MTSQVSPDSKNNGNVTVFMYEPELNYLKWLVLQKPNIETGGDLFGLWQDEGTAVVQLVLGPGRNCQRTTTSFYQDVDYLGEVGGHLTSSTGLCNIGEWHSHHRLGLAVPSSGDQSTVWKHMSSVAGGKFLVFIANISGTPQKVNIGCFLFNSCKHKMLNGDIKCLPFPSPLRQTVDNTYLTSRAETKQDWTTFSAKYRHSTAVNNQSHEENIPPNVEKDNTNTKAGKNEDGLTPIFNGGNSEPAPMAATSRSSDEYSQVKNGNSNEPLRNVESRKNFPATSNSNVRDDRNRKQTSKTKEENVNSTVQPNQANYPSNCPIPSGRKETATKEDNTLEETYNEEDALLSNGRDNEELSRCEKILKRMREILISARNFLRQNVCYC